jgi:uncharacterized protein (TIGR00725 family)
VSKYQICVSGASKGKSAEEGHLLAREAGMAIAKAGHSLMTGATLGLPNQAAEGYKRAGGKMSLGISPAASKVEHAMKYRLPMKAYDAILYTGLHYTGRDALLISSSDAVISIGGRIGTLHEFTIAMETNTPIGLLQGAGGVSTQIMDILHAAGETKNANIIMSDNADELVALVTALLDKQNKKYLDLYK